MANTINYAKKYSGEWLDEKFKAESKSGILNVNSELVKWTGVKSVLVPSLSLTGLGDYNRATGYPTGSATLTWEELTLSKDRGISFQIDRFENEETQDVAFGKVAYTEERQHIIPEIDAYRFSTIATKSGVLGATGTISANQVINALNTAITALDDKEVPEADRILFVSTAVNNLLLGTTEINKTLGYTNLGDTNTQVRTYNGIPIVVVPSGRFKSEYTFNANGGFAPKSTAVDINFILLHKDAVVPVVKHQDVKVFSPEVNQSADAYLYQARVYHDIFIPANKVEGIYVHKKSA